MTKRKSRKVMGFGTFDGIHPGHLSYLKQLRELGDEIYIVTALDSNVLKTKGRLPRSDEETRMEGLRKTGLADHVMLGDKENLYRCVTDNKPDVIGLGYDQKADTDELKKRFPSIRIVRLKAFEPERHKSSLLSGHSTDHTIFSLRKF